MSDIADDADRQIEQFIARAAQTKRPEGPRYTGRCANCLEAVAEPKRWCDAECRDQEQRRTWRRNGNT